MKNSILLFLVATFFTGAILTGCQTASEKVDDAKAGVVDAKQDLKDATTKAAEEARKNAEVEEWAAFKSESETAIAENEKVIAELKAKMKKSGKTLDALYAQRIDELEVKNSAMRTRISAYKNENKDWESFKREFNHDMNELGSALKDLAVDNKK